MPINEELRTIPSKCPLEQFDVTTFSKEKIRELFRAGKIPTAEILVDEILLRAAKLGATDLHFEPADQELRIRLCLDGILCKLVHLPKEIGENLANVLKTKASLNAFEKKKPQEGRFSQNYGTMQYDIRVSIVPIITGERIALRLFQKSVRAAHISELGLSEANLEKIRLTLQMPSGIFLATGPASSGKTTTVYAAVGHVHSAEKNLFTVENPIEYKLENVSQVAIGADKGLNFADALRAILHQRPDVIMVGEIRDRETGIVAAEAALTGNLVLSTMLSSDAIGTIYRLLDLSIPPYWLSTTLIGIVHQLLVRKICDGCREKIDAPQNSMSSQLLKFAPGNIAYFRGKGCEKCDGTGFLGRTALHEVLLIDDTLRDLICRQASLKELKEAAQAGGFERIHHDALIKVCRGITTLDEVTRVLG